MIAQLRDPRPWRAIVAFAALIGGAVALFFLVMNVLIAASAERTPARAGFLAAATDAALTRLDHLPLAISTDPQVRSVLAGAAHVALNDHLALLASRAGAEVIYLMDRAGLTVAASNHTQNDSFVGQNYAFRPYFSAAIAGKTGRFFAVGVTTGRPGYFVAEPVRAQNGTVIGVLVVKLGLETLTDAWAGTADRVLITTADGIVLAASNPDWRYQTLAPLTQEQRARIMAARQFDGAPLTPLDWQALAPGRVQLGGQAYLQTTAAIPREDWTLHLLADLTTLRLQALWVVAIAVAVLLTLIGLATLWRSARLRRALAISVADRKRLTREIEDRRKAQTALQAAQVELARASRLAALGQLSASITHELGQPISAMRNYIAAAEIAQPAVAKDLFAQLNGLVARMQDIAEQLRFFATPARRPATQILLPDVVAGALALVQHDLRAAHITLHHDPAPEGLRVDGVQHRLEQVMVNLLRNAQQALTGTTDPEISICYGATDSSVSVTISDNGTGFAGMTLDEMTEPFVTTKSSGTGMGLGLAISAQIVKDHAGQMTAAPAPNGGAAFTISLPRAKITT